MEERSNWELFVNYMAVDCGMQYDEEENFVRCSECGEPIYKEDFDLTVASCPCCTYNILTEEFDCDQDEE